MYLIKSPWWLRKIYASLTWQISNAANQVYLTFDDGPHPVITPYVLNVLKQHDARATFFCIGKNVIKYPEVYRRILLEGHTVGNHTHNHLNGWSTDDTMYINDILQASKIIDSKLFRPPYGKISSFQIKNLSPLYKIIMWGVLSGDFDISLSASQCINNVKNHVKPGSIVVFHDSEKAWPRLEAALPAVMDFIKEKEYKCNAIT